MGVAVNERIRLLELLIGLSGATDLGMACRPGSRCARRPWPPAWHARLVISRRTAEHHVQGIYAKIGDSSRAATAVFALEHGLVG